MSKLARIAFVLSIGSLTVMDLQAVESEASEMHCVTRLYLPNYPLLAASARIAADLNVEIVVGTDGKPGQILFPQNRDSRKKTTELFARSIEAAIRRSEFSRTCSGMKVTLVLHFTLLENLTSNQPEVSFKYPNQFCISIPPSPFEP